MSVVLGADHDAYKQFVPSYEIPLQSREIVVINEDAPRGSGSTDFTTPMSFMLQNGDPTKMIRLHMYESPSKHNFLTKVVECSQHMYSHNWVFGTDQHSAYATFAV